MSEQMSREETVKLFDLLRSDFKEAILRIETKIDVATENINKYAKDTIEHRVKIESLEKDVDNIAVKVRFVQRYVWLATGGMAVIIFFLNYAK